MCEREKLFVMILRNVVTYLVSSFFMKRFKFSKEIVIFQHVPGVCGFECDCILCVETMWAMMWCRCCCCCFFLSLSVFYVPVWGYSSF